MGRPARNHGGTGGRGCLPLPGERPNLNYHVLDDKTLQKLVQNSNQKPGRSTKLELLQNLPRYGEKPKRVQIEDPSDSVIKKPSDLVIIKEPEMGNSGKSSDCVGINDPKGDHIDKPGDSVSFNELEKVQGDKPTNNAGIKDPEMAHCVGFKKPKGIHNGRSSDSDRINEAKLLHYGRPSASISIKEPSEDDIPGDSHSINQLEKAQIDNAGIKDPVHIFNTTMQDRVLNERLEDPNRVCISDPKVVLSNRPSEVQVPQPSHSSLPEPLAPASYVFVPVGQFPHTYLPYTYFPVFQTIFPTEMPTNCEILPPSQHVVNNAHTLPYKEEKCHTTHSQYPFSIMSTPNPQMHPQQNNDQFPVLFNLGGHKAEVDSESGPCHFNSYED